MDAVDFVVPIATLLGGAGVGGIVVKYLNKPVDEATVQQITASARGEAASAVKTEVEVILNVLQEVKKDSDSKTTQLAEYHTQMEAVKERLVQLEERERHALVRAAVHEAWDQMAFRVLVSLNPEHPPPPPLISSADREKL